MAICWAEETVRRLEDPALTDGASRCHKVERKRYTNRSGSYLNITRA